MYWPGGVRHKGGVNVVCGFRRERGKVNADTVPARVGGREGELRAAETVRS